MEIDWNVVGTGVVGVLGAIGTWFMGKGKRAVDGAESKAERDVVNLLRQEVERLSVRLSAMESREGRMIRHIYRLEGLMRARGVEPPPFDIDSDTIAAHEAE
jgi:hypothetical protein